VTVSTFLTLYVVPCVYSLFSGLERPEADDEESSGHGHGQPHAPAPGLAQGAAPQPASQSVTASTAHDGAPA
jgi:hypothetical protein